jgi:hypothetical protein
MTIDWTEPCRIEFVEHFRNVMRDVFELYASMATGQTCNSPNDRRARYEEAYQAAVKRAEQAGERVRGNRRGGVPITKGDMRLLTVTALRVAADMIDEI